MYAALELSNEPQPNAGGPVGDRVLGVVAVCWPYGCILRRSNRSYPHLISPDGVCFQEPVKELDRNHAKGFGVGQPS
jgi:hypothetical protein